MHGSSSVPQYLQDLINDNGGEMPQTYGVPVEEIERGIKSGVRKVNIDTDCRMAITGQFRRVARENKKEFDPRKFMIPAINEMTILCKDRFERFGTAALPFYVIIDSNSNEIARFPGLTRDPQKFIEFLQKGINSNNDLITER